MAQYLIDKGEHNGLYKINNFKNNNYTVIKLYMFLTHHTHTSTEGM